MLGGPHVLVRGLCPDGRPDLMDDMPWWTICPGGQHVLMDDLPERVTLITGHALSRVSRVTDRGLHNPDGFVWTCATNQNLIPVCQKFGTERLNIC